MAFDAMKRLYKLFCCINPLKGCGTGYFTIIPGVPGGPGGQMQGSGVGSMSPGPLAHWKKQQQQQKNDLLCCIS